MSATPEHPPVTHGRLCQLLEYNESTGIFRWTTNAQSDLHGVRAGTPNQAGYILVEIDARRYRAHRLAWLYVNGTWPTGQIDHINGVRHDNRIANLRDATHGQNQHNRHGAQRNNSSGYMGVIRDDRRGAWIARIAVDGKTRHLGQFATAEAAHAAYVTAKTALHPAWVGAA